MIAATVVFDKPKPASTWRDGTRGLPYDPTTLGVIVLGVLAYTGGARTAAQIDDDGQWTSANAKLASLLRTFFGRDYDTLAYYSPDARAVEVARDAAWALGAEMSGAAIEEDFGDTPDDVVF